jgi:hypothetical protein
MLFLSPQGRPMAAHVLNNTAGRRAARDRRPRRDARPAACANNAIDRAAALAKVLPLWPHELEDVSPTGRRHILAKLRRALRAERRRGVSGHWTYDLARHAELVRLYREELREAVAPGRSILPSDG